MKLENLNPNKKNSKFTVNGNTYWISHGGFVADPGDPAEPLEIPEADAAKLLQGRAWKALSWDPSDPRFAKRMIPAPTGTGIGRRPRTKEELKWDQGIHPKTVEEMEGQVLSVPTKDGKPTGDEAVETKPPTTEEIEKSHEQTEAEVAAANARELEQDTGLLSDMGEPVSGEDTTQEIEAATAPPPEETETQTPTWTIPAEGEEWPDPVESMPIEFLREIAKAYEVSYTPRTGRRRLVKDITAAMYVEE